MMNLPTRGNVPNMWQGVGTALNAGAGIVSRFNEDQIKQEQQKNLLQDMVEKRAQANLMAQINRAEEARKQQEYEQKTETQGKVQEFGTYASTGKKATPEPLTEPAQIMGPQAASDWASPLIKPQAPEFPGYADLQRKAMELGVAGDQGVKEYLNDQNPLNDPDFVMNKIRAQGTGNRAPTEAMGRVAQRIAEAGRSGLQLSKQDLASIMAQEDPTGALFGTREGQGLMASRSTEEAMANSIRAAKNLALDEQKFGYAQSQDAKDNATKFAKNTSEMATIDHLFKKLDKEIPGGIYGTGGISGFGFGTKPLRSLWKTEEANKIRPTLQSIINKVLKKQSGAAVSDQEFDRLQTEYGINTTGTIEEFRQGLQNSYEANKTEYDTFRAADPETASILDERLGRNNSAVEGAPKPDKPPQASPLPAKPGLKAIDANTASDYLKRAGGDRKKAKLMLKKDGYDING